MVNAETAFELLKSRMDRGGLPVPEAQETYWRQRLEAATEELERMGIRLEDTPSDLMLLADFTAYKITNRDDPRAMPAWLRLELRERWISQERG